MGGLCSKQSNSPDNFSRPGRVLGVPSSKPSANSVPVPQKIPGSSGRTVGGGDGGSDPRNAAARAAEERATRSSSAAQGKLGKQLAAQKAQTRTDVLAETSRDERSARDADAAAEARNWN
ncbi:MAG: hypothetical protein Q9160_000142 [Pyrenula sp. 1 TL-2023]